MMKANVVRGNGFRGVLDYIGDPKKSIGIVGGNMSGSTPRELSAEFSASRQQRPDAKRPVWHCSLALPAGEDVDAETWERIAGRFMELMEFSDQHQYCAMKHEDTAYRHIHIVGSRIALDGSLWHGKWEARRAIEATQTLEREFGLTLTPGLRDPEEPSQPKAPTSNEIQMSARTEKPLPRVVLQQIVDEAIGDGEQSIFAFIERVEASGAKAIPNVAKTGRMNGFSFEYEGVHFKASDLGKAYGWKKLQERGVQYEQDREGQELIDAARRIKETGSAFDEPAAASSRVAIVDDRTESPAAREEFSGDGRAASSGFNEVEPAGKEEPKKPQRDDLTVDSRDQSGVEVDRLSSEQSSVGGIEIRARSTATQLENVVGQWDMRALTWRRVADSTSDLAAPINHSAVGSEQVTAQLKPDHKVKVEAWRQQHKALQSPFYRITAKPRTEDRKTINFGKQRDGGEIQYDAAQVENLIPRLRQKNAQGYDIYVTPLDPNHHYLVVDDLTQVKLDELKRDTKLSPCLIQKSSENNYQAIIKAEKKSRSDEQSIANGIVQRINRKYGDPAFTGVIHPFRMAGFANKKPGRNNVFTKVIEAAGRVCDYASGILESIRSKVDTQRQAEAQAKREAAVKDERQYRLAEIEHQGDFTGGNVILEYRQLWRKHAGLAKAQGWQLDYSVLDYRIATDLLKNGHDAADVGEAIISASPQLSDRHGSDLEGYAARTIGKARIEAEKAVQSRTVQEAKRPEQKPDHDSPDLPGMGF